MPVEYMCGSTDVTMQLLNELSGVMKELPDGIKMCYIKTLTNAWATSSRYHESKIHQCLFGCACVLVRPPRPHKPNLEISITTPPPSLKKDSLRHYLYCNPLWAVIQEVSGFSCGPLEQAPIDRLGIRNPSVRCIFQLALAFRVYHATKNDYLTKVLTAQRLGDYSEVRSILKKLAAFHWKEIDPGQRVCGLAP